MNHLLPNLPRARRQGQTPLVIVMLSVLFVALSAAQLVLVQESPPIQPRPIIARGGAAPETTTLPGSVRGTLPCNWSSLN